MFDQSIIELSEKFESLNVISQRSTSSTESSVDSTFIKDFTVHSNALYDSNPMSSTFKEA